MHEDDQAAQASAEVLRRLGPTARRLLSECVEHTGVERTRASPTAEALADAGFVFIHDAGVPPFDMRVSITPSLLGEEALLALETMPRAPPSKA